MENAAEKTAAQLLALGDPEAAVRLLAACLQQDETSEHWNDWATAEVACGRNASAESGLRRALELDPANRQAGVNLATVLIAQRRFAEAAPILAPHEAGLSTHERAMLHSLAIRPADVTLVDTDAIASSVPDAAADGRDVCSILTSPKIWKLIPYSRAERPATNLCRVNSSEIPISFQEPFEAKPAGQAVKQMASSFYRGENCNFNPYAPDHHLPGFCRDFVLKGHLPESKIISKSTRVTAFGSCFAQNITAHLSRLGFNLSKDRAPEVYVSAMGEGLVNVYALLQQFTWALEEERPPENLWHGFDAQSFGYDEKIRTRTREVFLNTDVFILTLGLSEIWFDEVTGGIFWRAVPMKYYDPTRHKFRVCSFAETKRALERMHAVIAKHVPAARIVFTLSPIPLAATFRPISCITASSASKAILRAALDEFLRERDDEERSRIHYFPAFEIINELFPHRFTEDGRHPHDFIVPAVMKIFEAYYCESSLSPQDAEMALQDARRKSAEMAASVQS
jgi:hypothetical protein